MKPTHEADIAAIQRIDTIPAILAVVAEVTGMRYAVVARVTRESWVACAVLDRMDFGLGVGGELEVATTLCSEVRDLGRPIVIEHASEDPEFCGHPTPRRYGIESYIAVPIRRANGDLFGTLCAIDARPARLLDSPTVSTLELFAGLIAAELDSEDRFRALRESEERLRLAQSAARVGSWDYDFARGVAQWSPEMFHLYGVDPDRVSPSMENAVQFIHPDDRAASFAAVRDAAAHGGRFEVEFRAVRADGAVRWVLSRGVVAFGAGGQLAVARGVDQDVTDRNLAELALRDADEKKNRALAVVAHELRNPLGPIRNAATVLRQLDTADTRIEWARDVIERQVVQMARLLEDLTDVSRVAAGKLVVHRGITRLAPVIHRAVEIAQPLVDAARHELVVSLPDATLEVDGDPARLAQVFSNLLANAAKYTPEGGHIRLSVVREGSDVVVAVVDDGIGIAPEHLPRVFEMFSQVEESLDRSQGGLGIGLSLVKGLVEVHGGRVAAHSAGLGRGSEFVVRLPLAPPSPSARPRDEARDARAGATPRLRVLVADDLPDNAESLGLLLGALGHDVRTAADGAEAVQVAEAFRPHVAFLDIGMPVLNGYEACRHIREHPWGRAIALVALSGWGQEEDRRRSREAGFDRHLLKPVEPQKLIAVLTEMAPDVAAAAPRE